MDDAIEVLFVEDDPAVRLGSTQALQLSGLPVRGFSSAEQVIQLLAARRRSVLVTDMRLPGMDGLTLLERALELDRDLPVILVSGYGDIASAVQAMQLGACDFIEKPYSPERLNEAVERAIEQRRLSLEVAASRRWLKGHEGLESRLMGRSSAMTELRRTVIDVAATAASVLITGETGTGKDLVARCLHELSLRNGRFVALNCGGLPESLFESEVFGHEAGSFTGAVRRRVGKLEHACGGTLFLDEVETMPPALQVKLLRVLQERQFERLGSNELLPMDCRMVAASKCDLSRASGEGVFRSDLYFRLGVVLLHIPPLRERREDIPVLLPNFLMSAARRYQREVPKVDGALMTRLMAHRWPGNVRELGNAADRLVLGQPVLQDIRAGDWLPGRSLEEQVAAFERHLIEEALACADGHAATASDLLKVPRKTLYDKLKRFGLSAGAFRG
jgi:DNA-binding NtrC family response regulator